MKNNSIFTIIAGVMLLLAIPSGIWPYAYYQILRWVVMVAGLVCAYQAHKENKTAWVWIMGIIAMVFNPIAPIYLNKGTWSIIDIVAAVLMFSYISINKNENK